MEINAEQIKKALERVQSHGKSTAYNAFTTVTNALLIITSMEQRIKELTEDNENLNKTISSLLETIKDIKGDTVRKMQERLKEYLDDFYNSGEDALLDVSDLIDQIAKEMVGGDNGT